MPRTEVWTRMVDGPLHGDDHYLQDVSEPPVSLIFTIQMSQAGGAMILRTNPEISCDWPRLRMRLATITSTTAAPRDGHLASRGACV